VKPLAYENSGAGIALQRTTGNLPVFPTEKTGRKIMSNVWKYKDEAESLSRRNEIGFPPAGDSVYSSQMFGSHLSISGGMHKALLAAETYGMETVQVFTICHPITD